MQVKAGISGIADNSAIGRARIAGRFRSTLPKTYSVAKIRRKP